MVTTQMLCLEDGARAKAIATDMTTGYHYSNLFRYLDTFPRPDGIPAWPAAHPRADARGGRGRRRPPVYWRSATPRSAPRRSPTSPRPAPISSCSACSRRPCRSRSPARRSRPSAATSCPSSTRTRSTRRPASGASSSVARRPELGHTVGVTDHLDPQHDHEHADRARTDRRGHRPRVPRGTGRPRRRQLPRRAAQARPALPGAARRHGVDGGRPRRRTELGGHRPRWGRLRLQQRRHAIQRDGRLVAADGPADRRQRAPGLHRRLDRTGRPRHRRVDRLVPGVRRPPAAGTQRPRVRRTVATSGSPTSARPANGCRTGAGSTSPPPTAARSSRWRTGCSAPTGSACHPTDDRVYVAETYTGRLLAWDLEPGGVPPDTTGPTHGGTVVAATDGHLDSLAVEADGTVVVAALTHGLLVVRPDGSQPPHRDARPDGDEHLLRRRRPVDRLHHLVGRRHDSSPPTGPAPASHSPTDQETHERCRPSPSSSRPTPTATPPPSSSRTSRGRGVSTWPPATSGPRWPSSCGSGRSVPHRPAVREHARVRLLARGGRAGRRHRGRHQPHPPGRRAGPRHHPHRLPTGRHRVVGQAAARRSRPRAGRRPGDRHRRGRLRRPALGPPRSSRRRRTSGGRGRPLPAAVHLRHLGGAEGGHHLAGAAGQRRAAPGRRIRPRGRRRLLPGHADVPLERLVRRVRPGAAGRGDHGAAAEVLGLGLPPRRPGARRHLLQLRGQAAGLHPGHRRAARRRRQHADLGVRQ